jgi:predicted Ser/Thr protein kinase
MAASSSDPGEPSPLFQSIREEQELSLETILLDKGWITPDQLKKALEFQAAESRDGKKARLGQILVRLEAVTRVQLRQALLLQGKTPMRCAPCNKNYNIKGLKPGRRALCKVCRAPLVSLVAADDLHADDAEAGAHQVPVGESVDPSLAGLIPGYEIERELGSGGMGSVYLARQKTLDRLVAIKLLSPRLSSDPKDVKRFLKESRAAAKLRHENIVRAIDAGEVSGRPYLVMEYMDGRTLADVLRTEGPLAESRALELAYQIAQGLQHAQHQGLIHGDVKPSNIILATDGVARICDFGLAREIPAQPAEGRPEVVLATRAYASPEQLRGDTTQDHRSDLFSLGVTLFQAVTGRLPFDAKDLAVRLEQVKQGAPSPRTLNASLSASTDDLIVRLLQFSPADRLPDYRSLLDRLQPSPKEGFTEVSGLSGLAAVFRKGAWRWVAAAVVAVACGAILVGRMPSRAEDPPKPALTSRASGLLEEARRFELAAGGRPEQYPAVLARWKSLVDQHRGTPDHGSFAAGYLEFQTRLATEAGESAQGLLDQSNLHTLARRTVEAIRMLERFPAGFEETEGASRIAARKAALETELDERYEEGKEIIGTCVATQNYDEARRHLEALKMVVSFPGPEGLRYLKLRHREELTALERSLEEEQLVAKRREGLESQTTAPSKEPGPVVLQPVTPPPATTPAVVAAPAVPRVVVKGPIPDASSQKVSEKMIRELFKQDYARTQVSNRISFSRRLLQLAGQTRDDPAGRFVLYREARDVAAQAGDPTLAFQAIDALAGEFMVDDLDMKSAVLATVSRSAMTAQACKDAASAYLALSDEAASRENADGVERGAGLALSLARRAKDVPLIARCEARLKEVEDLRAQFRGLAKARDVLSADPQDAEANLLLGRHLCFGREEWTLGLHHLRKGSDASLRGLAEKELARPQEAAGQLELGDAWWERASGESERTTAAVRRHAGIWYESARDRLTGPERERVDGRLNSQKTEAGDKPR